MHEDAGALPARLGGAALARALLRRADRAALATTLEGAPYVSLVLVARDLDASPLLLLSDLAQHSANIAADPRVALLYDGTAGLADPLAGPRLSVLGTAEPSADPRLLARFTARHPSSRLYAGFGDFRLYRVSVARGHLVAGFGHIEWIAGEALLYGGESAALAAAEPEILAAINADPAALRDLMANGSPARAGEGWQATGIDPEGLDLRRAGEVARREFPAAAPTPQAAHRAFAALLAAARGERADRENP